MRARGTRPLARKAAMIEISQTTDRYGWDTSCAVVDGRRYEMRSKHGSLLALCRQLAAAGVPDQPWQSVNTAAPGTVSLRGPSIHAAARQTVAQPDSGAPRFVAWNARDDVS
jgi:hypothetical protein